MRLFTLLVVAVMVVPSAFAQADGLKEELQQLDEGLRSARSVAEQGAFVGQFVRLGDQSFAADEFDVAVKAFEYAFRIARAARLDAAAEYAARVERAKVAAREYAKVVDCVGKDDGASKRKLAEFRAFVKGDWSSALVDLAFGDDAVAKAAQLDTRHLGGEEAEPVGDAWVEAARGSTAYAAAIYLRAGVLYAEAAGTIPTPQLMQKMTRLGAKIEYDPAPPKGSVRAKQWWVFAGAQPNFNKRGLDKLMDGSYDTDMWIRTQRESTWVAVDLQHARSIRSVAFAPTYWDSPEARQKDALKCVGMTVQVSNSPDFSRAITVFTLTEPPPMRQMTFMRITQPGVWRYVRICPGRSGEILISELQVYAE